MITPHQDGDSASPLDQEVVARAYRKVTNKQELTHEERRALKRYEKQKEERLRRKYYGDIPQRHWREMSGRQTKVLKEQAARYGIPFGGPTVNLPAVVRALHDFLADNAIKLARADEQLLQGPNSPALERFRDERAKIAKLDREERERQLVSRDEVRQNLARIATILRGAGDTLQRQFGPEAVAILYEALEDAEREIQSAFGNDDEGTRIEHPELPFPIEPTSAE